MLKIKLSYDKIKFRELLAEVYYFFKEWQLINLQRMQVSDLLQNYWRK